MKRKGQGNPKAERNERIVSHLIKRFKERHDITLTRSRRLMLIKQIQTKVAKRLCLVPNGKFLYRVSMYDNDTRSSVGYSVIYCPRFEQILTVLPRQDSPEYDEFVKKNGLSREMVEGREMTARERTMQSVQQYLKSKYCDRVSEGQRRLKAYKSRQDYFRKRLDKCGKGGA